MPTGFHPDGFRELGRAALLSTFAEVRCAWNAATAHLCRSSKPPVLAHKRVEQQELILLLLCMLPDFPQFLRRFI
jgi:hypothetical protein